jgi:flagellin
MVKHNGTTLYALANDNGSSRLTVQAQDLSLGGTNVTLSAAASFNTATQASAFIATLDTDIQHVNMAMTHLGTGSNAMASQLNFVGKLQDSLNTGISNLVDADMAEESAKLQALQTKQQLAVETLMIANQSNSILLSLFK